ncbi:DUF5714 domain-containing protein [Dethiobacter alkaliphilus]|uniref:DUF5714 domain-containing protein n=1 Tax=Dethiobacter alkaliphilus TaxID=427926 RepID=UPI0022265579|nr:DUF5714 domain-containing protein [Dethiobacter alkaliphilus]MCW3491571.1 DUF5714 domain-containing protein [Dethiobacter alkaliphilus]
MDRINAQKHTQDCMICGLELKYFEEYKKLECVYCHKSFRSNVTCVNGHYVCDMCHSMDAITLIENYCQETEKVNPIEMAIELMKNPAINMHGPEHHFLVPAVLLTAFYNHKGDKSTKVKKLQVAKMRAKEVKGGFCGFYGNCGAAVGTGICISLITDATPLTRESWGLANLMTGRALISLAKTGGPRCCKRNLFTSIKEAAKFIEEHFGVKMYDNENYDHTCSFKERNKECLLHECPYF